MNNLPLVRHFGIVTGNMEKSLAFYRDELGFSIAVDQEENGPFIDTILALRGSRLRTVKMTAPGGGQIELLDFRNTGAAASSLRIDGVGPTHLAIQVDDLHRWHRRLSEGGTEFLSEPTVSADGRAKVAFCRAPEGTFIELVEIVIPSATGG